MLRFLVYLGVNGYPAFLHEDVELSKDVNRDCSRAGIMLGADYVGRRLGCHRADTAKASFPKDFQ